MFASLKNKIREETGSDLSKLTAKITSSTVQKIESFRGRSTQGSTSSLNSIQSSEGFRDEVPVEPEEFRKKFLKIESDFARKIEHKENEWHQIIKEKDILIHALEEEKDGALKEIATLKESLKNAEEFNSKILEHKENNLQIENLQNQELSKVKQLVLLRDQEIASKTTALKDANTQLEKLRNEVSRLQRQEELLSDVQDELDALRRSTSREVARLAAEASRGEHERRLLADRLAVCRQSGEAGDPEGGGGAAERRLLERRLEEAHLHLADIKTSWSDKIAALETQVGRLSRQTAEEGAERRRVVEEKEKLVENIKQLEAELDCCKFELINKETKIKRLSEDVNELSAELKVINKRDEEEISFLRSELVSQENV